MSMDSNTEVALRDVSDMALLIHAVRAGGRIRMETPTGGVFEGVLRHFTDYEGDAAYADQYGGDLRDKWVRVSSTLEHWFSVRELIDGMRKGTVAF